MLCFDGCVVALCFVSLSGKCFTSDVHRWNVNEWYVEVASSSSASVTRNFEKTKLLLSVMFVLENFCGNSNRQSFETLLLHLDSSDTTFSAGCEDCSRSGGRQ